MSYLMYSKLFGLQEVKELPMFILPGTLAKFPEIGWQEYLKKPINHITWEAISKKDLPKQAYLEALLLRVQL